MIGTDLIEVERFRKAVEKRGPRFLRRIFTENELDYCSRMGHPDLEILELAARLAGKEAVSKLLGTGLKLLGSKHKRGVMWKEIEILAEPSGRPIVQLHGRAKKVAEKQGIAAVHISLTHIKDFAQAVALGERNRSDIRLLLSS